MPSGNVRVDDPDDVLSVFGDDLSRSILVTGTSDIVTARGMAETLDVSQTTVYRRLNRLDDLGLITEVTDVHERPSSETAYRTDVSALVVTLSESGVSTTEGSTALEAALSIILDRVDVTETTFAFEEGSMTVTLSMDDETLGEMQDSYRSVSPNGVVSLDAPNR